jgi:HSP20 family protein
MRPLLQNFKSWSYAEKMPLRRLETSRGRPMSRFGAAAGTLPSAAVLIKTLEEVSMATRYEPWAVVSQLQNEINRVFGNLGDPDSSSATAEWTPAVDIVEYQNRFELLVDLPGVDSQSVEITLDNGVLVLSGERRDENRVTSAAEGAAQRQRRERHTGRFYRRFILPDTVDTESVSAKGNNGVLEISIAKHAKAQPRRIAVK